MNHCISGREAVKLQDRRGRRSLASSLPRIDFLTGEDQDGFSPTDPTRYR